MTITNYECRRVYIYTELYNDVMGWVFKMKKGDKFYFRSPNDKDNFPFYLKKYVEMIKNGG